MSAQAPRAWLGFAGPGEQLLRRDRERNEQKSGLDLHIASFPLACLGQGPLKACIPQLP